MTLLSPPLRERRSDIRLLVAYFLRKIAQKTNRKPKTLSAEFRALLTNSPYLFEYVPTFNKYLEECPSAGMHMACGMPQPEPACIAGRCVVPLIG